MNAQPQLLTPENSNDPNLINPDDRGPANPQVAPQPNQPVEFLDQAQHETTDLSADANGVTSTEENRLNALGSQRQEDSRDVTYDKGPNVVEHDPNYQTRGDSKPRAKSAEDQRKDDLDQREERISAREKRMDEILKNNELGAAKLDDSYIDHQIIGEYSVSGTNAFDGHPNITPEAERALASMTLCVFVLRNGGIVTGEAIADSPETYDHNAGLEEAREDAKRKIWFLERYVQRNKLMGL